MSTMRELEEELDLWRRAGRVATFWWRDDDAVEASPALDRLLDLASACGVPLCLAVIPARASGTLVRRLAAGTANVTVAQHGFRHANHATESEKRAELGAHRPATLVREELARGRAMLASLFGERARPLLVPPWNRIDRALVPDLPGLGFRGLSTHMPRRTANPVQALTLCNTHLDVLRWRPERAFLGSEAALRLLLGHLRARRSGESESGQTGIFTDPEEPTGLLTHHLVMDEPAWAFVATLLDVSTRHPAARWLDAEEAFLSGPAAGAQKRAVA
jgi:hypothetical protein